MSQRYTSLVKVYLTAFSFCAIGFVHGDNSDLLKAAESNDGPPQKDRKERVSREAQNVEDKVNAQIHVACNQQTIERAKFKWHCPTNQVKKHRRTPKVWPKRKTAVRKRAYGCESSKARR